MVQVPQQVLSNLNLHLTAESPEIQNYGAEEMYNNNRRRDDGMYSEEEYMEEQPRSMYGRETSPEEYEEEEDYENYDYGQPSNDYDREYRENINLSNFGYSPEIVGGDLINYDTPYSNNDFDEREIIDNGGKPYGEWWNLDNILGDVNVAKGARKDSYNDMVGFGVSNIGDLVGIPEERVSQASFNDLFGFSGINSSGTLGRSDEYDPQTMFGFHPFRAIKEKIQNRKYEDLDVSEKKDELKQAREDAKKREELEKIQKKIDKANGIVSHDGGEKKGFFEKIIDKKKAEIEEEKEEAKLDRANQRQIALARANNAGKGAGGDGKSHNYIEITPQKEDYKSFEGIGGGGADIFGFNKLREDATQGGLGNPDVFGFSDMADRDMGETDTFGFQQMSENEGGAPTAESQFGFKIGAEGAQTAEDVFGSLGGHANSPMSFSDTFGFKDESSVPQSMSNVFGIHIVGYDTPEVAPVTPIDNPVKSPTLGESLGNQPDVRADLSSLQTSSSKKQVYKTKYTPKKGKKAPVQQVVAPQQQVVQEQSQAPQTHAGMYNRFGKMLSSNQEYASNFENYGYSLDVGGMFSGNNDGDQLVGFNSDVIGIGFGAPSKSRKVRVTSYTITGGKVTKKSTKVNGKYVEKKSQKKKSSPKKKTPSKNTKVKKQNIKRKSEDDYISSLIWGE